MDYISNATVIHESCPGEDDGQIILDIIYLDGTPLDEEDIMVQWFYNNNMIGITSTNPNSPSGLNEAQSVQLPNTDVFITLNGLTISNLIGSENGTEYGAKIYDGDCTAASFLGENQINVYEHSLIHNYCPPIYNQLPLICNEPQIIYK